jgi:arsenate reductase
MAEAFLRSFDSRLEVWSAGTHPAARIHPFAVKVMSEAGMDVSDQRPKDVDRFLHDSFDYLVTVCDRAHATCPLFTGDVRHRLHIGFDDPAEASGTTEEVLEAFRRVRDEIRRDFRRLYSETLLPVINGERS